jgi:TonB-linked SusC/RagA family outer membrane protein
MGLPVKFGKTLLHMKSNCFPRAIAIAIAFVLVSSTVFAQTKTISGVVSDKDGTPLAGATIKVKGDKTVTTSDNNGVFKISVPSNANTLVISYVGMKTSEVSIKGKSDVTVALESAGTSNLNEVVVVGYGKMKKTDLSSAQVSLSAADINKTVNTTLEQALQGRAAGVTVTQNSGQPGGGISVLIRGVSTLNGSTQPLYVIDGVQIQQSTDVSYGVTSSTSGNPLLAGLNPNDIESVEILQGPSATAIYGSRATNGVVLVTTKKGKLNQFKISYNYLYSLQDKPDQLSTMNLQQYAQMENQIRGLQNGGTGRPEFADPSILGPGTNWQDALFKTAPLQKHQLSMSGGSNNTTYYLSGEYFKQEGVATGSEFDRYSARLNLENQSLKWLKLSTNLSFNQVKEKIGSTSENTIYNALNMAPYIPVKDPFGNWGGARSNVPGESVQFTPLNPVAISNLIKNNLTRYNALGGISADITILKGLVFRTSLNGNASWSNGFYFIPTYTLGDKVNTTASLSLNNSTSTYWNLNQLLQYNTKIGNHDFGLMVSHEAQESNWSGISGSRTGFTSNEVLSLNLGNPVGQGNSSYSGSWAMESYLGRLNYMFNNKYILQASIRADGSVNFAPDHRWGYFPSASVAWRVSQEPFMESVTFINDLKLRFETGLTGNQGNTQGYYAPLSTNSTVYGTGFYVGRFANPDLKWESTNTNNFGFNLNMFKSRIQLEGDYYIRKSDNLLMTLPEPAYMGTSGNGSIQAPTVNIGALQNNGYAFTLSTINLDNKKGISWSSNFNISHFKTKITKFYTNSAKVDRQPWYIGTGSDQQHGFDQRSVVGSAPWLFFGYVQEGLFQSVKEINESAVPTKSDGITRLDTDPAGVWVGDIKYKDIDGNGIIDFRDQTFIGNPWPKFTLGFSNTVSYKEFNLSILLTGSIGNDVYNYLRFVNTIPNNISLGRNMLQETFDYAKLTGDPANPTISNPGTIIPRISSGDANGNAQRFTNAFVEDGSYVRIKNVTLSYTLKQSLLNKIRFIKEAHFALGVQNLATFTKYKGFDPEVGSHVGQNVSPTDQLIGVDAGRYPLTRIYTFSVGIDF